MDNTKIALCAKEMHAKEMIISYELHLAQMKFRRSQPGIACDARRATPTRFDCCCCRMVRDDATEDPMVKELRNRHNCLINKLLINC